MVITPSFYLDETTLSRQAENNKMSSNVVGSVVANRKGGGAQRTDERRWQKEGSKWQS
jgi:hypothetical protein